MDHEDRHRSGPDLPGGASEWDPLTPPGTPPGPRALPTALADVVTVRKDMLVEHELVLVPGATASDLNAAMICVPPTAALVGFHGDAELSLLFREVPRDQV